MDAVSILVAQQLEVMVDDRDLAVDSTLAVYCFSIFNACIRTAITTHGLQQLTTASAGYFCRTLCRLTATDPTSSILKDIHQRYDKATPVLFQVSFAHFLSYPAITVVNALLTRCWGNLDVWRGGKRPSNREHTRFAQDISELALAEYRRNKRVSKWIVTFALNSLSLDPLPSAGIVANCFEIIAIDFGYDVPDATTSDERCIHFVPICVRPLTTG